MRFRLRTLFVRVAVVAAVLAPIAWWCHRAAVRRNDAAQLRAAWTRIYYDFQVVRVGGRIGCIDGEAPPDNLLIRCFGTDGACSVVGVWCPQYLDENRAVTFEFSDAEMRLLEPFKDLRWLLIDSDSVTDEGAAILTRLSELEDVAIGGPKITDRTVERLVRHNRKLTALGLCDASITDRSIELLVSLPNLKVLDLRCTDITGESIQSIAKLDGLIELYLGGTPIGEGRLGALRCLPHLEIVDATDTGVSEQDVLELTAGRPDLKVYR